MTVDMLRREARLPGRGLVLGQPQNHDEATRQEGRCSPSPFEPMQSCKVTQTRVSWGSNSNNPALSRQHHIPAPQSHWAAAPCVHWSRKARARTTTPMAGALAARQNLASRNLFFGWANRGTLHATGMDSTTGCASKCRMHHAGTFTRGAYR